MWLCEKRLVKKIKKQSKTDLMVAQPNWSGTGLSLRSESYMRVRVPSSSPNVEFVQRLGFLLAMQGTRVRFPYSTPDAKVQGEPFGKFDTG